MSFSDSPNEWVFGHFFELNVRPDGVLEVEPVRGTAYLRKASLSNPAIPGRIYALRLRSV